MPQVQGTFITQKETQGLNLTPQQLLVVRLLSLSVGELEQRVKNEVEENVALEADRSDNADRDDLNNSDTSDELANDEYNDGDGEDYQDTIAEDLERYGASDEELPVMHQNGATDRASDLPIGDSVSFIEDLESQLMDFDLTERQESIIKYLIGSLDNRGYVERPISDITEELAFNNNMYDIEENEVAHCLGILQQFEPAGIGARDTQECLLLQIERQLNAEGITPLKRKELLLEKTILTDHYELFKIKNKEKLKKLLNVSSVAIDIAYDDIKKLSIYPGLALCESSTDRIGTQTPDFIVETDLDGHISMRLNYGDVPQLHVSRDFINMLKLYQKDTKRLSKGEKEGLMFTKERISAAEMFIESIKIRNKTLVSTMKAIIDIQKDFILSKDVADIKRMVLKDVAQATGYDISTISRVCSTKTVELDGRIYPLDYFFKLTRTNSQGEEVDGRQVETLIKQLVDSEDKNDPLSDDRIADLLKEKNVNLARRTIAKYRKELGIPSIVKRKA